jgi:hypothetical protein
MVPSLTQTQVETLLRAFLIAILPQGVEVTVGQLNLVAEPTSDNFVIMWPTLRKRLGTTVVSWDESVDGNPSTQDNTESVRLDMQLDFHGNDSTDNAQVFAVLFRSDYATQYFIGSGMSPDYCSDGIQAPYISGEDQFEDRWTLNAVFDANITVSTPQQFADDITVEIVNVDVRYPPS